MMFLVTMNMPGRSGSNVHQVIAQHQAADLVEFAQYLEEGEFILVEEYYKNPMGQLPALFSVGLTILNTRYVGKVRIYNDRPVP